MSATSHRYPSGVSFQYTQMTLTRWHSSSRQQDGDSYHFASKDPMEALRWIDGVGIGSNISKRIRCVIVDYNFRDNVFFNGQHVAHVIRQFSTKKNGLPMPIVAIGDSSSPEPQAQSRRTTPDNKESNMYSNSNNSSAADAKKRGQASATPTVIPSPCPPPSNPP